MANAAPTIAFGLKDRNTHRPGQRPETGAEIDGVIIDDPFCEVDGDRGCRLARDIGDGRQIERQEDRRAKQPDAADQKEWRMPPREWTMAEAQFAVIFGERFIRAMAA